MKRGRRDVRWADLPSARVRFVFESVFLILVAVGAALMELRPLTIVLLMACAWILVALIERASSREPVGGPEVAAEEDLSAPERTPEVEPREAYRWLFWRRARARDEEGPSPTAAFEARPSRSHVRRLEQAAEASVPEGNGAPAEPERRAPDEVRAPAVTTRPLDLPGLEEAPAPPASEPVRSRRALARAARRVVPPLPPATPEPPPVPPPREWNLWDLERRAREQAGNAPRDEEWSALFTHLRVFANADGVLPKEFDELVRESFGELIEAA